MYTSLDKEGAKEQIPRSRTEAVFRGFWKLIRCMKAISIATLTYEDLQTFPVPGVSIKID